MPPLYQYRCSNCEQDIDVLRTFDEYKTPPSSEEEAGLPDCTTPDGLHAAVDHSWERHIGQPLQIMTTSAWRKDGKKGAW